MDLLIALLPALFWGSVVLINVLVGGGPYNQIRGTTFGALIIGIILLLTGNAKFDDLTIIIVGLISGAFWGPRISIKICKSYRCFKTMPISTGLQLVGTTLFSAIFLGEWSTGVQVTLGLVAMVLLVIGIALTSIKGKNEASESTKTLVKRCLSFNIYCRLCCLRSSSTNIRRRWNECFILPIYRYGYWWFNTIS